MTEEERQGCVTGNESTVREQSKGISKRETNSGEEESMEQEDSNRIQK